MQEKESKTNSYFRISIIKSIVRIGAGITLLLTEELSLKITGLLLIGAEVLGILEEL
jgi:hypothetical protein